MHGEEGRGMKGRGVGWTVDQDVVLGMLRGM
jgi:hypothetical protein